MDGDSPNNGTEYCSDGDETWPNIVHTTNKDRDCDQEEQNLADYSRLLFGWNLVHCPTSLI